MRRKDETNSIIGWSLFFVMVAVACLIYARVLA